MGVVSNKVDITDLQKGGGGSLSVRVEALETVVGDDETGLIKDVNGLKTVAGYRGNVYAVTGAENMSKNAEAMADIYAKIKAKMAEIDTASGSAHKYLIDHIFDGISAHSVLDSIRTYNDMDDANNQLVTSSTFLSSTGNYVSRYMRINNGGSGDTLKYTQYTGSAWSSGDLTNNAPSGVMTAEIICLY